MKLRTRINHEHLHGKRDKITDLPGNEDTT